MLVYNFLFRKKLWNNIFMNKKSQKRSRCWNPRTCLYSKWRMQTSTARTLVVGGPSRTLKTQVAWYHTEVTLVDRKFTHSSLVPCPTQHSILLWTSGRKKLTWEHLPICWEVIWFHLKLGCIGCGVLVPSTLVEVIRWWVAALHYLGRLQLQVTPLIISI